MFFTTLFKRIFNMKSKEEILKEIKDLEEEIRYLKEVRYFNCEIAHSDYESDDEISYKDLLADNYNERILHLEMEIKELQKLI